MDNGSAVQIVSTAPAGWPSCRTCGCWEFDACWDEAVGACWWVEGDLCSHCEDKAMIDITCLVPGGILPTDYVHEDTYDETCSRCRQPVGERPPLMFWLPPDQARMLVYCDRCNLFEADPEPLEALVPQ